MEDEEHQEKLNRFMPQIEEAHTEHKTTIDNYTIDIIDLVSIGFKDQKDIEWIKDVVKDKLHELIRETA